jgi:hypothetical protein
MPDLDEVQATGVGIEGDVGGGEKSLAGEGVL